MKITELTLYALLFVGVASCGTPTKEQAATPAEQTSTSDKSLTDNAESTDLINSVYNIFVFATDADAEINYPEKYFTANALKKLQEDYTFDCDEGPCYAFYALRTDAQDSRPGSDEASLILSIELEEDGWYIVSYSDMGWPGKTRIRIVDSKIDDYHRLQP